VIFGALYGLSTIALYELLGTRACRPFYDKLLQVPILNLSITLLDRAARSKQLRAFDPGALAQWLAPRQRHLAYMSVWAIVFAMMSAAQGVGDSHPGQWLPFWQQACRDERAYACPYFETVCRTTATADRAGRVTSSVSFRLNASSIMRARRNRYGAGASSGFPRRA
jgi:hypothetical protein